ncbi:MAG TPA: hypothetical protein VJ464_11295 [Blastocatellia bacterium]|nr:hypothetical protein [Blastocatellia bacterium]
MPKKQTGETTGERPAWLAPVWEAKKAETLTRVTRAIREIEREGGRVSLREIAKKASFIDGRPLSATTIQHNEAAYEEYLRHRRGLPPPRRRSTALAEVLSQVPDKQRRKMRARISYLRRMRKDDLIAKVILLGALVEIRDEEAARLRDEILRLMRDDLERTRSS